MAQPAATSSGEWILEHLLAALTLGSFGYFYWLMTKFDVSLPIDELQSQLDLPAGIVLAGSLSFIAAIVFWIRMSRDFFRQRPERHAAAWGLLLLIGAHFTALVYFAVIWRPRHRPRPG
jgi:hypothetical protein